MAEDDVTELRRRLDMAEDELTFLKAVFEEYKDSSGELEAELDAQLKDLERSNLALKRENEQIRAQLQSTVSRSRKSAEEASNLTTALEAHLEELTKREMKAQSRIKLLEQEMEALKSQLTSAQNAVVTAPAAPTTASTKDTGASSAEFEAAKKEVARLSSDIKALQSERQARSDSIAAVKSIVYDARVLAGKLATITESRFSTSATPVEIPQFSSAEEDDVEAIRFDASKINELLEKTHEIMGQSDLASTLVSDVTAMLSDHHMANAKRLEAESERAINISCLTILGKILVLGSSLPQFKKIVAVLHNQLLEHKEKSAKDKRANMTFAHKVLEVCQDIMVTVFQPIDNSASEEEKEKLMAQVKADALAKIEEVRRREREQADVETSQRLAEAEAKARKAIEQLRAEQEDVLKKELQSARTEAKQLIEQARREALEEASVSRKVLEEEIYQSVAVEMDALRAALEKSEAEYQQAAMKQKMYQDSMRAAIVEQSKSMMHAMRLAREEINQLKRSSQEELANTQKVLNDNLSRVRKVTRTLAKSDAAQLSMMYERELEMRVRLQDQLQSLKGNIRVFCRIRPLLGREIEDGESEAVTRTDEMTVTAEDPDDPGKPQSFMFDRVFGPQDEQQVVFDEMRELCLSAMDGYNVCLFAYGITGSGKTFTVEGGEAGRNSDKLQGLVFRTIKELYRIAYGERSGAYETQISVQLLELYNEEFRDLLIPPDQRKDKVEVRLIPEVGVVVDNVSVVPCASASEAMKLVNGGYVNRTARFTQSNNVSSRSHSILTLHLKGRNIKTNKVYEGKLHFVDLAGSERVGKSGVQGEALKEAQAINKSLSALGDVIQALSKGEKFVPFRNSQLTQLLKESLGGNSKTVMICNIAPCKHSMSETVNSLRFATRAHSVEMGKATQKVADNEPAKVKSIKGNLAQLETKFKEGAVASKQRGAAAPAAAAAKDKMVPPTSARGAKKLEKSPRK
eukprot:c32196_g1_i1.p1 GENE.c32196_g1_i1~~c32196_g1_i1.p1  ORF type:complete len:974 (-),score=262.51 c32196_g1_i1:114-3035(-)